MKIGRTQNTIAFNKIILSALLSLFLFYFSYKNLCEIRLLLLFFLKFWVR